MLANYIVHAAAEPLGGGPDSRATRARRLALAVLGAAFRAAMPAWLRACLAASALIVFNATADPSPPPRVEPPDPPPADQPAGD